MRYSAFGQFFMSLGGRGGETATTTALVSWQYPNVDGITINYIDEIFLQWTSNFPTAVLEMWCQNGTAGNNVVLGSQFPVDTSGRYGYVLANEDPAQAAFPVACHGELVQTLYGAGGDTPFGITFTSQANVAAQTFSLTVTSTSTSATVSQSSITSISTTTSATSKASATQNSTTPSLAQTSKSISTSTGTALTSSPISTSPSTTSSATSLPSASNNTGAIVGGVLGGLALICLVVFCALFLRWFGRRQNPRSPPSPSRISRGWWHHQPETTKMQTAGLHEKDGTSSATYEVHGETAAQELDGRTKSRRWTLVELPT